MFIFPLTKHEEQDRLSKVRADIENLVGIGMTESIFFQMAL